MSLSESLILYIIGVTINHRKELLKWSVKRRGVDQEKNGKVGGWTENRRGVFRSILSALSDPVFGMTPSMFEVKKVADLRFYTVGNSNHS